MGRQWPCQPHFLPPARRTGEAGLWCEGAAIMEANTAMFVPHRHLGVTQPSSVGRGVIMK